LIRCGQGIISLCWRQTVSRYFMRLNIPTCDFLLCRYGGSVIGSFGHKIRPGGLGLVECRSYQYRSVLPKTHFTTIPDFWMDRSAIFRSSAVESACPVTRSTAHSSRYFLPRKTQASVLLSTLQLLSESLSESLLAND
jgi:hypothetical protein